MEIKQLEKQEYQGSAGALRTAYGDKRLEKHPGRVLEHGIGRDESAGIM